MYRSLLQIIYRSTSAYGLEIIPAGDLTADEAAAFERQCARYTIGGIYVTVLTLLSGTFLAWPNDFLVLDFHSPEMKTVFLFRMELLTLTIASLILLKTVRGVAAHPVCFGTVLYSVAVAAIGWLVGRIGGFDSPIAYSVYTVPLIPMLFLVGFSKRILITYGMTAIFFVGVAFGEAGLHGIRGFGLPIAWSSCTAALAVVFGHVFFIVLRTNFVRGRKLDDLSRNLQSQVLEQSEKIRKLTTAVMNVQEEERRRISHDLHDGLGQTLTRIRMEVDWMRESTENGKPECRPWGDSIGLLDRLTGDAHETLDRVLGTLQPLSLEDRDFNFALHEMVRDVTKAKGVNATLSLEANVEAFSDVAQTALYRIVQEATTNIVKHSVAKNAWVSFLANETELEVRIRDDGRGFDPESVKMKNRLGIRGIMERAKLLNGHVEIHSELGRGCEIAVFIPLERVSREGAS